MMLDLLQANNPLLIIIAGLVIGLVHAFEPDHVSTISTQLLKNNNGDNNSKKFYLRNLTISSSLKGILWGMGHTSSIVLIGLLVVGLSLSIPNDFFIGAEIIAGLMLIVLGVFTFTNKNIFKHTHPHKHSDNDISHTHSHIHDEDHHRHDHKSYLIGCVHGLAGSGSLVGIVASTMNGFDMMIYFLILFGMGSIIGMGVTSGILGLPFILLSKIRFANKYLRYVVAGISFVIGANIILSIGLNNKLFF